MVFSFRHLDIPVVSRGWISDSLNGEIALCGALPPVQSVWLDVDWSVCSRGWIWFGIGRLTKALYFFFLLPWILWSLVRCRCQYMKVSGSRPNRSIDTPYLTTTRLHEGLRNVWRYRCTDKGAFIFQLVCNELAIDKLKSQKSPGIDQIPAELIETGGGTICLETHKLTTPIWKKEKLPEEWKESFIIPIHKKGNKTDWNNYRGISLLPTTYKILSNNLLSRLIPYAKEIIGIISVAFHATRRLLITYSAFAKYLRKNGNTMKKFIISL